MLGKEFFENYVGQTVSLNISENEKPFWITGKVTEIKETYFFFELTTGNRIGTVKTLLYTSIKEVDLPAVMDNE